jgi:hypothetical protein
MFRIVSFSQPKTVDEILDNWSSQLGLLFSKIERVTQLIDKERVTSGVPEDE